MKFLVHETLKVIWYYSSLEVTKEINENRKKNNLPDISESIVLNHIGYLKEADKFLNLEGTVCSYYEVKQKINKQALSFVLIPENKEMVNEQIQGLLDYMIDKMSNNNLLSEKDIIDQAFYLEKYYHKRKMSDYLEEKYPEKAKASVQKPKKI